MNMISISLVITSTDVKGHQLTLKTTSYSYNRQGKHNLLNKNN